MNHVKQCGVALAVLTMAAIAAVPEAHARGVAASAGRATYAGDIGCFGGVNYASWGALTNSCSTNKQLIIPLVADATGNEHDVWVDVYAPDTAHTVQCNAIGMTADASHWYASSYLAPMQFGMSQQIPLSGALTPGWGYLVVVCGVDPGATVNSVSYNP
jgi:hypothetical protein